MVTHKVFEFDELPDFAADHLFHRAISVIGDSALDYCAYRYSIGSYVAEYDAASDKHTYNQNDVNLVRQIDQWFYAQGCVQNEIVYIYR